MAKYVILEFPANKLHSQHRHLFLLGDGDADVDSNAALSHAPAASQGFGAVPVGFSAGCPVATLCPCLLPSSDLNDDADDADDADDVCGIPQREQLGYINIIVITVIIVMEELKQALLLCAGVLVFDTTRAETHRGHNAPSSG